MWQLDLALADVVATSTDPRLGAIRLAWWRERLDQLDEGEVPAEPTLIAAERDLLSHGVAGRELSPLEDGWLPLLNPFPWNDVQAEGLRQRGRLLFGVGARLLGGRPEDAEDAGALWSLVDGARHCSDEDSRQFLIAQARREARELPHHPVPREVRHLTGLAALSAYDIVDDRPLGHPTGGVGRGLAAIWHLIRGRLPRE